MEASLDESDRTRLEAYVSLLVNAYHEAAHAVIGRALGQVCGHVTIEPDLESAGHSITAEIADTQRAWELAGRPRKLESILRGRVISTMAGADAANFVTGQEWGGDSGDRAQISAMTHDFFREGVPDDVVAAYNSRLRRWSRYFVRVHWERIKAVAFALIEQRTLQPGQIDTIIGRPSLRCAPANNS